MRKKQPSQVILITMKTLDGQVLFDEYVDVKRQGQVRRPVTVLWFLHDGIFSAEEAIKHGLLKECA